jgi:hypothetical protein
MDRAWLKVLEIGTGHHIILQFIMGTGVQPVKLSASSVALNRGKICAKSSVALTYFTCFEILKSFLLLELKITAFQQFFILTARG